MRLSKIQVGGLIAAEAVEDSSMDTGSYALIEHHDENLQKIVERIIDLVGHIGISNETINDNISGAAEGANGMVLAIDASNQVTVSSKDNELGNRLSSMEKTIERRTGKVNNKNDPQVFASQGGEPGHEIESEHHLDISITLGMEVYIDLGKR